MSSVRDTDFLDALVLSRDFYTRPTVDVARGLIGMTLVHGRTAGRIIEAEAYLGLEDKAAHAARGVTRCTEVIFGPPGHAYVYLIYGMYECLNLIAEPAGVPGCVLIRALEPLAGIALMQKRRGTDRVAGLASGPGKLTIAMGITRKDNGRDVTTGPLTVRRPVDFIEPSISTGTRIGIRHCRDWPLRFLEVKTNG